MQNFFSTIKLEYITKLSVIQEAIELLLDLTPSVYNDINFFPVNRLENCIYKKTFINIPFISSLSKTFNLINYPVKSTREIKGEIRREQEYSYIFDITYFKLRDIKFLNKQVFLETILDFKNMYDYFYEYFNDRDINNILYRLSKVYDEIKSSVKNKKENNSFINSEILNEDVINKSEEKLQYIYKKNKRIIEFLKVFSSNNKENLSFSDLTIKFLEYSLNLQDEVEYKINYDVLNKKEYLESKKVKIKSEEETRDLLYTYSSYKQYKEDVKDDINKLSKIILEILYFVEYLEENYNNKIKTKLIEYKMVFQSFLMRNHLNDDAFYDLEDKLNLDLSNQNDLEAFICFVLNHTYYFEKDNDEELPKLQTNIAENFKMYEDNKKYGFNFKRPKNCSLNEIINNNLKNIYKEFELEPEKYKEKEKSFIDKKRNKSPELKSDSVTIKLNKMNIENEYLEEGEFLEDDKKNRIIYKNQKYIFSSEDEREEKKYNNNRKITNLKKKEKEEKTLFESNSINTNDKKMLDGGDKKEENNKFSCNKYNKKSSDNNMDDW